jgi:hypothetical protein
LNTCKLVILSLAFVAMSGCSTDSDESDATGGSGGAAGSAGTGGSGGGSVCPTTPEGRGCPPTRAAAIEHFLHCRTIPEEGLGAGGEGGAGGTAGELCTLQYPGGWLPVEGPFAGRCGDFDVLGYDGMTGLHCYYDVDTQLAVGASLYSDCMGCGCETGVVGLLPPASSCSAGLELEAQCVQDAVSGACTVETYFP